MKRFFKVTIYVLVISSLLLSLLFSGCSKQSTETKQSTAANSNTSEAKDISTEKITLKYFYPLGGDYLKALDNLNESLVIQEMEKKTNIHMEFIHPPFGQEKEQYNLMIASDDLPDIITHDFGIPYYPGGGDKAIKDGKYLRLNELVDQYAPNFKKIISDDADLRKNIVTDEGNIWGLPMIDNTAQEAFTGLIIRKDWLDELGLQMPKTINDWYNTLKAFKEKKGAESPFILNQSGYHPDGAIIGAFGVGSGFYQVDKKIKYGPLENGFKEYLMEMNKWYKEGLIDKDFPTGSKATSYMTTGKSGAVIGGFWAFNNWEAASTDKKMVLVGAPYPSLKEGEKPHFRQSNLRMRGFFTSIASKCKYPERAIKWMDYFYSDEGYIMANYGFEGKTFTKSGNKYKYTDLVLKNPEGVSMNIALAKYCFSHGAFLRDWTRDIDVSIYGERALDATHIWHNSADADYKLPPISLTAEEGTEFSKIMGDIDTYVNEMVLKFIIGAEQFDKYDQFLKQINNMNIKKAIELQQAALDRYNKK